MTMKSKLMGITAMALAMGAMSTPRSGEMKQDTDELIKRSQEEIDAERERNIENHRKLVEKSKLERAKRKHKNEMRAKATEKIQAALKRKKTKQHGKLIKNV